MGFDSLPLRNAQRLAHDAALKGSLPGIRAYIRSLDFLGSFSEATQTPEEELQGFKNTAYEAVVNPKSSPDNTVAESILDGIRTFAQIIEFQLTHNITITATDRTQMNRLVEIAEQEMAQGNLAFTEASFAIMQTQRKLTAMDQPTPPELPDPKPQGP